MLASMITAMTRAHIAELAPSQDSEAGPKLLTLGGSCCSKPLGVPPEPCRARTELLNPVFRIVLLGTCDTMCPWFLLQGHNDVIRLICEMVKAWWVESIDPGFMPADELRTVGYEDNGPAMPAKIFAASVAYDHQNKWFPRPSGININMMPIKLGYKYGYRTAELPSELKKIHTIGGTVPGPP